MHTPHNKANRRKVQFRAEHRHPQQHPTHYIPKESAYSHLEGVSEISSLNLEDLYRPGGQFGQVPPSSFDKWPSWLPFVGTPNAPSIQLPPSLPPRLSMAAVTPISSGSRDWRLLALTASLAILRGVQGAEGEGQAAHDNPSRELPVLPPALLPSAYSAPSVSLAHIPFYAQSCLESIGANEEMKQRLRGFIENFSVGETNFLLDKLIEAYCINPQLVAFVLKNMPLFKITNRDEYRKSHPHSSHSIKNTLLIYSLVSKKIYIFEHSYAITSAHFLHELTHAAQDIHIVLNGPTRIQLTNAFINQINSKLDVGLSALAELQSFPTDQQLSADKQVLLESMYEDKDHFITERLPFELVGGSKKRVEADLKRAHDFIIKYWSEQSIEIPKKFNIIKIEFLEPHSLLITVEIHQPWKNWKLWRVKRDFLHFYTQLKHYPEEDQSIEQEALCMEILPKWLLHSPLFKAYQNFMGERFSIAASLKEEL
jgi:hypothetical protein